MSCTPQKTTTRPADDWADFDPTCTELECFLFQFIVKKKTQDSVSVHQLDVQTVFTCAIGQVNQHQLMQVVAFTADDKVSDDLFIPALMLDKLS